MSHGWAKASACCLQTTLSCAFLCHIVSLQYLSRSSLHRLAGLPCRLFLSYGLQLVTREVHRSSLRRLICPAHNGVARILFGRGPPGTFPSPLREPTAFSGGGGGSSRNFPLSQLPGRIQWGGGVVAEIFRDLYHRIRFSGGGGSRRNFSR